MAEKTGVTIEINAEDKASQQIEQVGKAAQTSLNPMGAILQGLNGNFQAMGQSLLAMIPKVKALGASMMSLTLVAAAIGALVKLAGALTDHFANARKQAENMKLENAEGALKNLRDHAAGFAKEMEKGRKVAEQNKKIFEDQAKSIEALTKAQNDFNKAQELAAAKSEDEKAAIERRYAEADSANAAYTDEQIRANRIKNLEEERARLEEEVADNEDTIKDARESWQEANVRAQRAYRQIGYKAGFFGWTGLTDSNDELKERGDRWSGVSKDSYETLTAAQEKAKELEKKLEMNAHEIEMANREAEIKAIERKTEVFTEDMAEENALEEIAARDEAEIEKARIDAEKERHDQRIRDINLEKAAAQTALTAEQQAQKDAEARLSAAQSKVAQAWGWYRDKSSMQKQLEEEKAEKAAEEQYVKDFDKLRSRSDWRTAKNLNVDQEAVRRVALAKEEETAAKEAVLETARATQEAAETLKNIEAALTEE